jgi:hypothetical protein
MVRRTGMIIETDRIEDPHAPVAQGQAPPYWYRCAEHHCTTQIAPVHKYWPFCTNHWHNQPRRGRDLWLELPGI